MDIETRAAELIATWEHGDENHRQWLRDIAMPGLLALATEVEVNTLARVAAWHFEQAAKLSERELIAWQNRHHALAMQACADAKQHRKCGITIRNLPPTQQCMGPENSCGAGICHQPEACRREGECHYTKSPFYGPGFVPLTAREGG